MCQSHGLGGVCTLQTDKIRPGQTVRRTDPDKQTDPDRPIKTADRPRQTDPDPDRYADRQAQTDDPDRPKQTDDPDRRPRKIVSVPETPVNGRIRRCHQGKFFKQTPNMNQHASYSLFKRITAYSWFCFRALVLE